jgi:hypothetical protein
MLNDRYRASRFFGIRSAVLFDPLVKEGEHHLSFAFWQALQLRDDRFLKSHFIDCSRNMYIEGKKGVEIRYIPANARSLYPCGRSLFAGVHNK